MRLCEVAGCDRPYRAKGGCNMHYQRLRNFGTFDDPRPSREERFWSFVEEGQVGECWPWSGGKDSHGYGQFGNRGAHRVAYEFDNGAVPDGLQLDHLCHTEDTSCAGGHECPHRACVNPAHLEPVTLRENQLRSRVSITGINAAKTHCDYGHEFTIDNTRIVGGKRICQACKSGRKVTLSATMKETA